jgi:hypothetical protein
MSLSEIASAMLNFCSIRSVIFVDAEHGGQFAGDIIQVLVNFFEILFVEICCSKQFVTQALRCE